MYDVLPHILLALSLACFQNTYYLLKSIQEEKVSPLLGGKGLSPPTPRPLVVPLPVGGADEDDELCV